MPLVRRIGPQQAGSAVTVRLGQALQVSPDPAGCERPWRLVAYPHAALRLVTAGAQASFTFQAVALGSGPVTLVSDQPGAAGCRATGSFTVQVRVLRDTVKGGPGEP